MVVIVLVATSVNAQITGDYTSGPWKSVSASYYNISDTIDMSGDLGGWCGYGDLLDQGYGSKTTALSPELNKDGLTCGACFELKCVNDTEHCLPGNRSIFATTTNICPPDFAKGRFGLPRLVFTSISRYTAFSVPVSYRRVPCKRKGGIRFKIVKELGSPTMVRITNVARAGDVVNVSVKGTNTEWIELSHHRGQIWTTNVDLVGQSLSFRVRTSDGRNSTSNKIAPSSW